MNNENLIIENSPTFRLFALPSFIEGAGSVIDIFGSFDNYNHDDTPEEADLNALRSDWRAIGLDFEKAVNQFQEEEMGS